MTAALGKKGGIRARWLCECFLPAGGVVLLAAVIMTLYVLLSGWERAGIYLALLWGLTVLALAALFLAGAFYIRDIARQLERLRAHTRRMKEGAYGDLTKSRRDDELGELTDSLNELDGEISRSKATQSEFISSVSHELRTPLTAIMGWAEALEFDEALQGDSRRGVEIISKEAARLTKMVAELLEFTRIQDGRFNLNLETVDLAAEVEDAMFTYRNLMEQEGVALRYELRDEDLPQIDGDPERLKQVLLNILDNAAKYGRDGETIEVSVDRDGGAVCVSVRDHGPGIPPEELPRVKERFYKGSSKERGSGIGLAVCEEIVTRHGGTLSIENAPGGGVLATVRLPIRETETGDAKERLPAREKSHGRDKQQTKGTAIHGKEKSK